MADIHIQRKHTLGLAGARKIAWKWAEQAEAKYEMSCTYAEGEQSDELRFQRSGVNGTLTVTGDLFQIDAKLGFLLSAFKERIEDEILKGLDKQLAAKAAARKKT